MDYHDDESDAVDLAFLMPRIPSQQDATIRNVRASKKRTDTALGKALVAQRGVEWLVAEVSKLATELRRLAANVQAIDKRLGKS